MILGNFNKYEAIKRQGNRTHHTPLKAPETLDDLTAEFGRFEHEMLLERMRKPTIPHHSVRWAIADREARV